MLNRLNKWVFSLLFLSLQAHAVDHAVDRLPPVEVYVPGLCLACLDWAEYLRQNGFPDVKVVEVGDMTAVKRRLGVPADLESVHTAKVGAYFVEGHVPAEDIKQLLVEKPKARGIAVPGLPRGAPGRELSMPSCETGCTMLDSDAGQREIRREMFNTMLIDAGGRVSIWARH